MKCNNIHSPFYNKWCVKRKCSSYPCSQFKVTPKNKLKDVVHIRIKSKEEDGHEGSEDFDYDKYKESQGDYKISKEDSG